MKLIALNEDLIDFYSVDNKYRLGLLLPKQVGGASPVVLCAYRSLLGSNPYEIRILSVFMLEYSNIKKLINQINYYGIECLVGKYYHFNSRNPIALPSKDISSGLSFEGSDFKFNNELLNLNDTLSFITREITEFRSYEISEIYTEVVKYINTQSLGVDNKNNLIECMLGDINEEYETRFENLKSLVKEMDICFGFPKFLLDTGKQNVFNMLFRLTFSDLSIVPCHNGSIRSKAKKRKKIFLSNEKYFN